MKQCMKQRKRMERSMRGRWSLLLICSLLLGMLPEQAVPVRASGHETAAEPDAKAGQPTLHNPATDTDGITTWDTVYFGGYWQNDTNGDGVANQNDRKEAIRWRVLSVDGDDVFLLADQNLDCRMYNDTATEFTWETCGLRSWLNSTFLNNAFTPEEQSAIRETLVENPDNPEYGTEGGNDTTDRVYLLSIDEVTNPEYGFSSDYRKNDKNRRARNTEYARAHGAYTSADEEYAGNGIRWLRSPGDTGKTVAVVNYDGNVCQDGNGVLITKVGVQPALHLNLSSATEWSYGGTVTTVDKLRRELKNPTTDADGITTWDTVYFGSYWQNDTTGDGEVDQNDDKEPIRWRVLSVDGDDVFLLADQNLDCQLYDDRNEDVTWEISLMRSWLNSTFLNNAFTSEEQLAIRETLVETPDNPVYGTEGGNDTTDKVYLLSLGDTVNPEYGFPSDYTAYHNDGRRRAENTMYAAQRGSVNYSGGVYAENGAWWLRSPGYRCDYASNVCVTGYVNRDGNYVLADNKAVRPVLHLDVSSDSISGSVWSYGGKVNSEGENGSRPEPAPTMDVIVQPTSTPPESSSPGILRNPVIDADGITAWDTVYFGSYWQSDTNGDGVADQNDDKEPIRWRVLSVKGDDAFLLADKSLDCELYNDTFRDITWETCTLRSWLKDTFINNAFTQEEQVAVRETLVENLDNPVYGTKGGKDTIDKVYLLSIGEAMNKEYGFSSDYNMNMTDQSRSAKTTEYAKGKGARAIKERMGNGWWWLRSPGSDRFNATGVDPHNSVDMGGYTINCGDYIAVRPALHLNLNAFSEDASGFVWTYGGTVKSEDGKTPMPSPEVPLETLPPSPEVPMQTPDTISTEQPTLNNPATDADGITTWDTVYFGSYWQNDTNDDGEADQNDDKEPVRWRVLSVDGDDAFLLADQNLDCQPYNDTGFAWETCALRRWLNDTFLNNAFTDVEQSAIGETVVKNADNSVYGTEGGNDTTDQVYLLSIEEMTNLEYGFSTDYDKSDKTRRAKNTEYAKERGAYASHLGEYAGNGWWWLRSPGNNRNNASFVDDNGRVDQYGYDVNSDGGAVRPALHLNLSSATGWSYGGTVTIAGELAGTASTVPANSPMPAPEKPGELQRELKNPTTDAEGVTTWDTIYFGSYWQNDTNGDGIADQNDDKEPILWRVLSVDGDDAFLLADQNLDSQPYDDTDTEVTWETCTLRRWLNDIFLNNVFTDDEQSAIRETVVANSVDPDYGSESANDTIDQVYLLSPDEVKNPKYGFLSDNNVYDKYDKTRMAKNTEYAKEQGAWICVLEEYAENGIWWLRSPSNYRDYASYVNYSGCVYKYGYSACLVNITVRPALHLNLSSATGWSYAGTVNSEGSSGPRETPDPFQTTSPVPPSTPTPVPVTTEIPESASPSISPDVTEKPIGFKWELNNPRTDAGGSVTWDTVYFGSYWQNDTNGDGVVDQTDAKEPIMWRVLSCEGDDECILMSDQSLDSQPYNETYREVSWAECTLRKWLNRDFLQEAFSETDQKAIQETTICDDGALQQDTQEGSVTDRIYLLSVPEALDPKYGFDMLTHKSGSREASNTAYAQARGAYCDVRPDSGGNGWWWLRSRGGAVDYASAVDGDGMVDMGGYEVSRMQMAVRPVLRINLELADWKKAGWINADGQWTPFSSAEPTASPATEPTQKQGEQPGETSGPDDGKHAAGNVKSDGGQLKRGSIVTAGGIRYKIMSTKKNNRTVMLWRVTNKSLKTVTVPDTVKLRSQSFRVIKIADRAFQGCKKLKRVTVGRQVEIIGNKSFSGCKKLKRVIIRSRKLKKIGKSAFSGISKNARFNIPKGVSTVYRKMIKKAQK